MQCLQKIWMQALENVCDSIVSESILGKSEPHNSIFNELRTIVTLVETRESINMLLNQTKHIDMIIPRGSSELVQSIQRSTTIPVMGHSEGICHIYIDEQCNESMAIEICIDAKTDYPSACNSVETILIHHSHSKLNANDSQFDSLLTKLINALKEKHVSVYAGPELSKTIHLPSCSTLSHEYGALAVTIECVSSVVDAIEHINRYSSHHTDSIITSNNSNAHAFTTFVDSACVFVNASTRFADGFRFGLGAEVGISTGRVHARGPVGIEGLCTYKWKMCSTTCAGFTVTQHTNGKWQYSHKEL
jgi:delta-1-pyrroline-5-carboxylate synthetase